MSLLDTASLIVTPNGYKEGKLYSVIPSDGSGDLSVTRATTATRVNSAGLVELVPYNLVNYSEQFDNAAWTIARGSVTANATTAPNGTTTADKFVPDTQVNPHFIYQSASNLSTGERYTSSVYAKISEWNSVAIFRMDSSVGVSFRLDTQAATVVVGSPVSYSITSVGNGWYRLDVCFAAGSASDGVQIRVGNNSSYGIAGNNSDGLFLWGAQFVEGSVAKDYQKTETRLNIPRLDYSNGTCPSILVEPQRTNVLTYSSSFSNAAWNALNCTITVNNVVSPSGIQNADTAVTTANNSFLGRTVSISSDGSTYTQSVFAKWVSGYELFKFRTALTGGTAVAKESVFNLKTGAYISGDTTYKIEDYGNGWFRFSHQITNNSTNTTYNYQIFNTNDSTQTQSASFWGAQLEAGSYATSYIPTTSASVTRNADVISKTGISSLIGQTEGTLFLDVDFTHTNKGSNEYLAQIWVNSYSRILLYRSNVNGGIGAVIIQASSTIYSFVSTVNTNERHKIAFAYKSGDIAFYIDGSSVSTSSSSFSAFSSMENYDLGIHTASGSAQEIGDYPYNSAALWKTRLTNAQLATLTTI